MTVLAVVNQKGGVGKTTTVVNLGAYLGVLDRRILVVDSDAQANATNALGRQRVTVGLYDVLVDDIPAIHAIARTENAGVDILPATPELAGAEIELLDATEPARQLRERLEDARADYDYVLIDCPPSLGLLTVNALVAADAVLIPVQCEYLALEGLARLMDTLDRIRRQSNPALKIYGLLMTMYDSRTSLSHQVVEEVRRHYPTLTFDVVIPRNVRLSEAPSFGLTIRQYDPLSRGAAAYEALAREIVRRPQATADRLARRDA